MEISISIFAPRVVCVSAVTVLLVWQTIGAFSQPRPRDLRIVRTYNRLQSKQSFSSCHGKVNIPTIKTHRGESRGRTRILRHPGNPWHVGTRNMRKVRHANSRLIHSQYIISISLSAIIRRGPGMTMQLIILPGWKHILHPDDFPNDLGIRQQTQYCLQPGTIDLAIERLEIMNAQRADCKTSYKGGRIQRSRGSWGCWSGYNRGRSWSSRCGWGCLKR